MSGTTSSFGKVILRTPPPSGTIGGTNLLLLRDSTTGELFVSASAVAQKQPAALGASFGLTLPRTETCGQDILTSYTGSLTDVVAVGTNIYNGNTTAVTTNVTRNIFMGNVHVLPSATSIDSNIVLAQGFGQNGSSVITSGGVTRMSNCTILSSGRNQISLDGATGDLRNFAAITCGEVNTPINPTNTVLVTNGPATPGGTNLILRQHVFPNSVPFDSSAATGCTFICSSSTAASGATTVPAVSNTTLINAGTTILAPTASNQLAVNHTSFYAPNLSIITASANDLRPVLQDPVTGFLSPYNTAAISKVLRANGTTGATGQVTFNTGTIVATNATINATALNASATVAYSCQINAITASSVTIRVFISRNAVAGAPTMIPAPAGVVVHFTLAY